jgi:hypothetical protein
MIAALLKPQVEVETKTSPAASDVSAAILRREHTNGATAVVAKALNVSPRSVDSAAKTLANGVPALKAAVIDGKVSVSTAAAVATLATAEQEEVVASGTKAVVRKAPESSGTPAQAQQPSGRRSRAGQQRESRARRRVDVPGQETLHIR